MTFQCLTCNSEYIGLYCKNCNKDQKIQLSSNEYLWTFYSSEKEMHFPEKNFRAFIVHGTFANVTDSGIIISGEHQLVTFRKSIKYKIEIIKGPLVLKVTYDE